MIKFKCKFDQLAKELDGQTPPSPSQSEAKAEVYPGLACHTEEENFHADKSKDKGEAKICQKSYPEVYMFYISMC